jgi:hypothetical protein
MQQKPVTNVGGVSSPLTRRKFIRNTASLSLGALTLAGLSQKAFAGVGDSLGPLRKLQVLFTSRDTVAAASGYAASGHRYLGEIRGLDANDHQIWRASCKSGGHIDPPATTHVTAGHDTSAPAGNWQIQTSIIPGNQGYKINPDPLNRSDIEVHGDLVTTGCISVIDSGINTYAELQTAMSQCGLQSIPIGIWYSLATTELPVGNAGYGVAAATNTSPVPDFDSP